MTKGTNTRPASTPTEQARDAVRQTERGDPTATERLRRKEHTHPEATEAAEQEASDGPNRRGLSR